LLIRLKSEISIHALREESDPAGIRRAALVRISIHALREESDADYFTTALPQPQFLSTLSVRRATANGLAWLADWLFLSTLSVRRATARCLLVPSLHGISIHALREESDR